MYGEYQRVYTVHCLHKLWHTVHLWAWSSVRAILRYIFEGSVFTFLQVVLTQKTVSTATTPLWYPLGHIQRLKWVLMWQYKVLLSVSSKFSGDLKPYFYSFSCHGYLQQGSWLEATINSALSSLWQMWLQTDNLRHSRTLTSTHCTCR